MQHTTSKMKQELVLDYAQSFGNTVKEGLKRTTTWATHYFTSKKLYYPIPTNVVSFWNIPLLRLLPPLTTVSMSNVHQDFMREWARDNGKSVCQRTVRQETTKYKSGTLPLNMYHSEEQIGEKVKFDDAGDDEEDLVDEYSSQSSSRDSDADIGEELRNQNWSFLKTSRSGRNISVNQKYGL